MWKGGGRRRRREALEGIGGDEAEVKDRKGGGKKGGRCEH